MTKKKEIVPIEPLGWRVLVKPMEGKAKSKGGVLLPDEVKDVNKLAATTCEVIKVGALAYAEVEKFPNGPWVKEGDIVMIERFSGSKFKYMGKDYRLLNDDEILAISTDPDNISHA